MQTPNDLQEPKPENRISGLDSEQGVSDWGVFWTWEEKHHHRISNQINQKTYAAKKGIQRPWGLKTQWGYEEDSVAVVLALRPKSNCTDQESYQVITGDSLDPLVWQKFFMKCLWAYGIPSNGVWWKPRLSAGMFLTPDYLTYLRTKLSFIMNTYIISLTSSTPYCYQPQEKVFRTFRFVRKLWTYSILTSFLFLFFSFGPFCFRRSGVRLLTLAAVEELLTIYKWKQHANVPQKTNENSDC